jgi:hypothetical protein
VKNYVIPRRRGWKSTDDLETAEARSRRVGNEDLRDHVRWIRTYVVHEPDGTLGTFCIYQATGPDAIRRHAALADVPADEILEIAMTNIVRSDPEPASA